MGIVKYPLITEEPTGQKSTSISNPRRGHVATLLAHLRSLEPEPMWLVRKSVLLLILGACVLISSCDGPRTTVAGESRSPDGKMVATAYRLEAGGIGTGDIATHVYLNWTKGSQAATIILAFKDGEDDPNSDMSVGMNWITPTHLELTYKGPRTIDFEAVKCHGIDISLRDLSGEKSRAQAQ